MNFTGSDMNFHWNIFVFNRLLYRAFKMIPLPFHIPFFTISGRAFWYLPPIYSIILPSGNNTSPQYCFLLPPHTITTDIKHLMFLRMLLTTHFSKSLSAWPLKERRKLLLEAEVLWGFLFNIRAIKRNILLSIGKYILYKWHKHGAVIYICIRINIEFLFMNLEDDSHGWNTQGAGQWCVYWKEDLTWLMFKALEQNAEGTCTVFYKTGA